MCTTPAEAASRSLCTLRDAALQHGRAGACTSAAQRDRIPHAVQDAQDDRARELRTMVDSLSDEQLLAMHGANGAPGAPPQSAAEIRAMLTEAVGDEAQINGAVDESWTHLMRVRPEEREYLDTYHRLPLPAALLKMYAGAGGEEAYEAQQWPVNPALTPLGLDGLVEALMEPLQVRY